MRGNVSVTYVKAQDISPSTKAQDISPSIKAVTLKQNAGDNNAACIYYRLEVEVQERNRVVTNQENQINALNNQVTSLKEVVSITHDLLQIRNMGMKQLEAEVNNMEKKISEERDQHNMIISKMDLSLFQSLREKYSEKVSLLSKEKEALETATSVPE
ncbi:hypothetical protein PUN28_018010 [Cardiocondyla obscurior]|uniref:Uncharacterized protein n=1 Tax=Cardiocondyla obscurior TaxID=286306 RepID=A0AAW2EFG2_9HYME